MKWVVEGSSDGREWIVFAMVKSIENGVRILKVDGLIWNYLYNCRPMALTSHFLKKWVEESAGVPTLALEVDIYDSRSYSAGNLRTKVEAFAEMLRARKVSAARKEV